MKFDSVRASSVAFTLVVLLVCFTTTGNIARVVGASRTCPRGCDCNDPALIVRCDRIAALDYVPHTLNPAVRELYLEFNNIRQIKSSFEFYKNLVHLDLNSNGLQSLGERNFQTNLKLETLVLAHNNITDIQAHTFDGLGVLKKLDLSQNQLVNLNTRSLQSLKSLQVLDLSFNELEDLQDEVFVGLSSLLHLNLSNNNIQQLAPQIFLPFPILKNMNLSSNRLAALHQDQFQALPELETLDLSGCSIAQIHDSSLRGASSLRFISLHSNALLNVPSHAFQPDNRIEMINLGGNLYESIHSQAFKNLKSLKFLYISNNSLLVEVHPQAFDGLDSLQFLEMSSNTALERLDRRLFDRLFSLSSLVLAANNFTTLEVDLITRFKNDLYLDVRHNPLICNCSLEWLNAHFLRMFNKTVASNEAFLTANNLSAAFGVNQNHPSGWRPTGPMLLHSLLANNLSDLILEENAMDVRCAAPFSLEGRRIIKLHKDKFGCFIIESFVPIFVGGAIGALIVTGVVVLSIVRCKYQLTGFVKNNIYYGADQIYTTQSFDLYQKSGDFVFVNAGSTAQNFNDVYGHPQGATIIPQNHGTTINNRASGMRPGEYGEDFTLRYPLRMTPITEL